MVIKRYVSCIQQMLISRDYTNGILLSCFIDGRNKCVIKDLMRNLQTIMCLLPAKYNYPRSFRHYKYRALSHQMVHMWQSRFRRFNCASTKPSKSEVVSFTHIVLHISTTLSMSLSPFTQPVNSSSRRPSLLYKAFSLIFLKEDFKNYYTTREIWETERLGVFNAIRFRRTRTHSKNSIVKLIHSCFYL